MYHIVMFQNNHGLLALEVLSATLKDAGRYVCKAVNSAGEAECSATVKVESKSHLGLLLSCSFKTVSEKNPRGWINSFVHPSVCQVTVSEVPLLQRYVEFKVSKFY